MSARLGRGRFFTKVRFVLHAFADEAFRNSKLVIARCATSCPKPASWHRQSGRSHDHLVAECREYVCYSARLVNLLMPRCRGRRRVRREAKFRILGPQLASSHSCCSRERSNENSYNSSTRPSCNQCRCCQPSLSISDQSSLSLATSTLNDSQMALSDVTPAVSNQMAPLVLPFV